VAGRASARPDRPAVRTAILVATLAFVVLLGFLTVSVLISEGPDVLVALSALVLAMLGLGIVGALRQPPR